MFLSIDVFVHGTPMYLLVVPSLSFRIYSNTKYSWSKNVHIKIEICFVKEINRFQIDFIMVENIYICDSSWQNEMVMHTYTFSCSASSLWYALSHIRL